MSEATNILRVDALNIGYGTTPSVVEDVSFSLPRGQTLGLVGESGSGKSSIARVVVGYAPARAGSVLVDGQELTGLRGRRLRALRRRIQIVPQDPYSSLNPRMTIARAIEEGCDPALSRKRRAEEVDRLLEAVALPAALRGRRPHELSGGQRQRVALARALAVQPAVLIADEITSALDCSVQAEILELLQTLRRELHLSMLFISHDLAVVAQVCDAVAVLRDGRLVEHAGRDQIFDEPQHAYTRELLRAAPRL